MIKDLDLQRSFDDEDSIQLGDIQSQSGENKKKKLFAKETPLVPEKTHLKDTSKQTKPFLRSRSPMAAKREEQKNKGSVVAKPSRIGIFENDESESSKPKARDSSNPRKRLDRKTLKQ